MLLHFKNNSDVRVLSDILARCGLKMSPPWLKTRSLGELDAGILNARIAGL